MFYVPAAERDIFGGFTLALFDRDEDKA